MPVLSGIYVYPIKSAAGVALSEARVEVRGLAWDRRWMLVDAARRFLSQRTHPQLALVRVRLALPHLVVEAPGLEPLTLEASPQGGTSLQVRVWQDEVSAVAVGAAADAWFSRFLGVRCRLVYMPEESVRPVDAAYRMGGAYVSFADAFPVLLASEGSLDDLNARLEHPVPMNRFRPNLVVAGCAPFAEDAWQQVQIGSVGFHVVKPCARCSVVTVDQARGVREKEPLRTLARYRKREGKVLFGQNLIAGAPGVLRLGDLVQPVARVGAQI